MYGEPHCASPGAQRPLAPLVARGHPGPPSGPALFQTERVYRNARVALARISEDEGSRCHASASGASLADVGAAPELVAKPSRAATVNHRARTADPRRGLVRAG